MWVGVNDGRGQTWDRDNECLFGGYADIVRPAQGHVFREHKVDVGVQLMTDPAQPHPADVLDALDTFEHSLAPVDQLRVNAVHQSPIDLLRSVAEDQAQGRSDRQPDEWVSQGKPRYCPTGTDENRQRGVAVGAGVQAVCDQSRRSDPASDPEPVPRDELVACETADGGGRHSLVE